MGVMTHDELLAKIDGIKPLNSPAWNMQNTLRAVVEQAQPMLYKYKERQGDDPFVDGWNLAMRLVIEAIAKELK